MVPILLEIINHANVIKNKVSVRLTQSTLGTWVGTNIESLAKKIICFLRPKNPCS